MGQNPAVGAHGDVEAVARAVFPHRDLSGMQDPPDPSVGAAAIRICEITQEVAGVVDREIGAAAPGADLSDGDDPASDAQLLEPSVEGRDPDLRTSRTISPGRVPPAPLGRPPCS